MPKHWICWVLALVLLATACSKAPAPPPKGGEPDRVITIRVGLFDTESSLEAVIAAFQDKYPQYRVVEVPLGSAWEVLTSNRLERGEVDVVSDATTLEHLVLSRELVANLDPFIAKSRLNLAPYGSPLETVRLNGHIYGLPVWNDPVMFVYNTELLGAAKAPLPATSWTWDEFRAMAARLTSGEGEQKIWGFDPVVYGEDLAYMFALQKTPAGDLPEPSAFKEAVQFFDTMISSGRSMPRPPSIDSTEAPGEYCYDKHAVMCAIRLSTLQRKTRPLEGFGIAPFPAATQNKPVALVVTRTYTMLNSTPEPEAAFAFLSFLAGPEGETILARQRLFPAYFSDDTKQAWLESSPPPPAGAKTLLNASWFPRPVGWTPTSPLGVFLRGANKLWSGGGNIDKIVHDYETTLAAVRAKK